MPTRCLSGPSTVNLVFSSTVTLIWSGMVNSPDAKTEAQVHDLAGDGGLETDALNLQLLDETIGHAFDHVVHQRAAQAVQRFGCIFAIAADDTFVAFHLQGRALRQFPIELAFGPST